MSIYCLFALPKKDSIHLPKIYLSWIAVEAGKKSITLIGKNYLFLL